MKETLKNQITILFILFLVFFCQKLVKILAAVVNGEIPTNLVCSLLWLGMPEMAQLILPLSLFLSLLITFGTLYTEGELVVIQACGFSEIVLVKTAMLLALITGIIAAINVTWASPISSRHQNKLLAEAKANPEMMSLVQGKFQQTTDGKSVLFIKNVKGRRFIEVFLAQLCPKGNIRPSVVMADYGQLKKYMNTQVITLNNGTRFEGTAMLRDFHITDFHRYQAVIGYQTVTLDRSSTEQMDIYTLINIQTNHARAELQWRITLIFTVFMMALMAVPLSTTHSRQNHVLSVLPAILLYLTFFLLQTSIKSNGEKGKINPIIFTWIVNGSYLLLAIGLNIWNTVLIRHLRIKFTCRGII